MRSVRTAFSARFPRRPPGMPKNSIAARARPPPAVKSPFAGRWNSDVVCAVVLMVRVEVAVAPDSITEAGLSEQVGISVAPAGVAVTVQVNPTLPAKGFVAPGTTEIIADPVPPCVATVIAPLLLKLNVPGATTTPATVTATVTAAVVVPEVPVTVTA